MIYHATGGKAMRALRIATVLTALCAISIAASAADPPSFPLLCHGGPGMRIVTNHDVDGAGVPGATAMFIYFTPAAKAGSVQKPGPGECVWLDRTFRPGEPAVLWIKSPRIEFAFQVTGDGRVFRDATGLRLNVEGTAQSAEARHWQYLVDGVMKGQLFTTQVFNSGGRVMVVTSVGP
jgi:hypothetical protein